MKNIRLIALFSLLCLLVLIPTAYAMDNQTDCDMDNQTALQASDEDSVMGVDCYFDANIDNDNGNGSSDNPYRNITPSRVKDNSVNYLNDGEYRLTGQVNKKNVTIIGQDPQKTILYFNGIGFNVLDSLTLQNLTLVNLAISSNSNSVINATNVIFKNSTSSSIYAPNSNSAVYLENATFLGCHAKSGGAIYLKQGTLEIANSLFVNNYAEMYGGAIYVRESRFNARNLVIVNSTSRMGGAITSLYTHMNLTNLTARNNNARYSGGAIYAIFGSLSLQNSTFINNTAKDGGALFIDEVGNFIPFNNSFTNNTAASIAGAVYSAISRNLNHTSVLNESLMNSFFNNAASLENDVYECEAINLNYNSSQNYMIIQSGPYYDLDLPDRYDLRDYGMVTPVKNQGGGGNCWAFASLASLESCILKATGGAYDLSEENMKDVMSKYSGYGWYMNTNDGGYDRMGHAYLASWLGPVNESDDRYDAGEVLSPVLNSIFHIQNILFLERTGYTDNDAIKRAIMSYGAVTTCMHMYQSSSDGTNYYTKGKNLYWYRTDKGANHAVAIVGWDDNYSRNNFKTTPPGDGAWIIKNSWGTGSGEGGYYYVSYYDTILAPLNSPYSTYVFLFNDSIKYDKNYQYDVSGRTDFFLNKSATVWYKNVFTATDNEYLTAVSTYFEKDTAWEIYIYVNDVLRHVQSGNSTASYSTIELSNFIPLDLGDVFEVVFKITVDKEASVPISEDIIASGVPINKELFHENISFISYDGENWTDFYGLVWAYSSHTYASQVACIKAFTILNEVNYTTNLTIDVTDELNIKATIINQYGILVNGGNLTFIIGGKNYTVDVVKGIATLNMTLSPGKYNISTVFNKTGYVSMKNDFSFDIPINTTISIEVNLQNPVNITAMVFNQYGYAVKYGNVTFSINGTRYTVNVSDGIACLNHFLKGPHLYNISATFNQINYYASSSVQESFYVPGINTYMVISADSHNPVDICAEVMNEYGYPVDCGNVTFVLDDGTSYTANVSGGIAIITHIFKTMGKHNVSTFFNSDYYNSSENFTEFYVSLINTTVELMVEGDHNPVNVYAVIKDQYGNFVNRDNVTFVLDDGSSYTVNVTDGRAALTHIFKTFAKHNVTAVFNSDYYYNSSDNFTEFDVSLIGTSVELTVDNLYNPVNIHAVVKDQYGNVMHDGNVTFTVDNTEYLIVIINGSADLTHKFNNIGSNNIHAVYSGLEYYYAPSNNDKDINIKSAIVASDATKTFNSEYEVKLLDSYGNPLSNTEFNLTVGSTIYRLKTNENGIAKLGIDFKPGSYNVKIINPANDEVKTQTIKVVSRISSNKDVTMYYGAGKYYKVRVYDDNGNVAKNVKVTFTVNKKKYTRTTDSNGYASFKISLNPAKYTITAEYKGYKVSNKITVKTTLVTKNIKVKKGKTIKFTAKLLNSKGKILKYKKVTFKFKGKTYKIKTNKKGIATLKITKKYKVGKYTITTSYGKLKVKNTIRVKK